jgi:hypothetical protein
MDHHFSQLNCTNGLIWSAKVNKTLQGEEEIICASVNPVLV